MAEKRKCVSVRREVYDQFREAAQMEGKSMAGVLTNLVNEELDAIERIEKRHPLLLQRLLANRRVVR